MTADPPQPSVIAIIVALASERACVEAGLADDPMAMLLLKQSGPGPDNAAAAARAVAQSGADALVSLGLAGGLEPRLQAGTAVVPDRIVLKSGEMLATDSVWKARIVAAIGTELATDEGALLSADSVLHTPDRKSAAARTTGAVAVDMESAAIAAVAAAAGLPAVAIRVVADCAADTLPAGIERWIDPSGHRRLAPIAAAALSPAQWPVLALLARRHRAAQRALRAVAQRLAPTGFEFAPRPPATLRRRT